MTRRGLPLLDVLPEYYPYRDEGCEVSPACLQCPLPQCKYDDPEGYRRWLAQQREARDRQIWEVRQREGLTVPQLAQRFGVSQRTVFRALARWRGSIPLSPPPSACAG
ncbi:MAG: helix-turn-helix domain-containing protein [Dehalococcoidia bacterium]|nr:helix-turn-helix domain-containing protein [Dehalococcoidia bacterium]MDW8119830.1 helix-turn-helix domain-containing protein [Chloroflexota bacterium]